MREKLNQVARHYARTGSGEPGPAEEKEVGDLTEFWRNPTQKDLLAWRSPATIVNTTEKNHGRYGIVWGGKYFTVPSDQLRPHFVEAFMVFFGGQVGSPILLMRRVEGLVLLPCVLPLAPGSARGRVPR